MNQYKGNIVKRITKSICMYIGITLIVSRTGTDVDFTHNVIFL